jgi:hypothetical protein
VLDTIDRSNVNAISSDYFHMPLYAGVVHAATLRRMMVRMKLSTRSSQKLSVKEGTQVFLF